MAVNRTIFGRITKLNVSLYPPRDKHSLWAKPLGDNKYSFLIFNNGSWQPLSSGGGGGESVIEVIKVNNISLPINNKTVNIDLTGYALLSDIPDISGLYTKPSTGIPSTDLSSAVQTSLGKADTALQSYTETDPTVPAWAKESSKPSYTAQEVGALPADTPLFSGSYNDLSDKPTIPTVPTISTDISSDSTSDTKTASPKAVKTFVEGKGYTTNTGTITGITMNGSSKGTSGVVDLGTVITDISSKQDVIDSSHKLSADLIEDGTTNKVINVKPDWNAASGDAAEILHKPTIPAAQVQSDWDATTGMGVILNKPTIPVVPTNVSAFTNDAGYLTAHQDISGKEDKVTIDSTAKTASFSASVGNYYKVNIAASGSVTITLTTPSDSTKLSSAIFLVTTSTSPSLTFASQDSADIYKSTSYSIEASKVYEINAMWNGSAWLIASVEMEVPS